MVIVIPVCSMLMVLDPIKFKYCRWFKVLKILGFMFVLGIFLAVAGVMGSIPLMGSESKMMLMQF